MVYIGLNIGMDTLEISETYDTKISYANYFTVYWSRYIPKLLQLMAVVVNVRILYYLEIQK